MTSQVDFDIIFLALARWDAPYSSTAFSLAKALSKTTRVFFIDNPVTVSEYFRGRNSEQLDKRRDALLRGEQVCLNPDPSLPNLFVVTSRLSLPINWLPKGKLFAKLSVFNDRSLSNTINRVIKDNHITRFVFINSFNPLYGNSLSFSIPPLLRVYQCVDDIDHAPYLDKHGPMLERSQIKKADFTIVTSRALKDKCSKHSEHVFLIPNAAHTDLFKNALTQDLKKPAVLEPVTDGRKVITYIGNLCQRIDYALVEKVARAHPDKCILLIGPRAKTRDGKSDYVNVAGIAKLPNVVLTGPRTMEELPAFLQFSDCCIIPFLCNDLTKSIYPLKINEYLSAGRAVVSTAFSDDIKEFQQVVKISENHQQFVDAIDKVIENDSEARKIERMMFAASNNWEARARSFIQVSVEFLKHHDRRTGLLQRRDRDQIVNRF